MPAGKHRKSSIQHLRPPSAVRLRLPQSQFGEPVALTAEEIESIVERFVNCAVTCKEAGFTGVQFHSAHGPALSVLEPANEST